MVPTLDYIFVSEFDKLKGVVVKRQFPSSPAVDQLEGLIDLLMPLNLHKYLNTIHYTVVPLFIDPVSGLISWQEQTKNCERIYLYTLSYFQEDSSYRNGTAMALSILTRLPLFDTFKPLMTYLLHNVMATPDKFDTVELALKELNKIRIAELVDEFRLNKHARFLLSRLDDLSVSVPSRLTEFTKSDRFFRSNLNLGKTKFPLQIPALPLVSSSCAMYGIDLARERLLRDYLIKMKNIELVLPKQPSLVPYSSIQPLHVIFNAILTKKKIVLYSYDSCYNDLMDIAQALLLLVDGDYPCYPILDLATLDIPLHLPHYIVGTSNLLFKDRLPWDLFLSVDSNQLLVREEEDLFEKKVQKRLSSESKFRQLFRRGTPSVPIIKEGIDHIVLDNSWDPTFPLIDPEADKEFFAPVTEPNFFSTGFSFTPSIPSNAEPPHIHTQMNQLVDKLVADHHGDLTIYQALTKYLYELDSIVFKAFKFYINLSKLKSYRHFALLKLEEPDFEDYTLIPELRLFIRENQVVLPLAINHPYKVDMPPPVNNKLLDYYTSVVNQNHNLFKTFQKIEVPSDTVYYWLDGYCFELDLYLLSKEVSQLLERGKDVGFPKRKLYQLFRAINQLLKSRTSGGFEKFLAALYVQSGGFESFENLLIIASIYINKPRNENDEVMIEFKRFLSLILNHQFLTVYLLPLLNDFIKLSINDFIDHHMY
ncbi:hypothetical protein KL949_005250 [Ogataea haglerorum]|nr:hypothetical protein KL914_005266 [Ogataea haglerorum]KAG7713218.1 hypothetical protein KL913_005199 [Ogataea haglerorum]KAG7713501.1 hypothetical protein KL949_005250 [Ogataea haglerorum]